MEFISLDGFCRLVRSAGWQRRDVLRAIESGQLAALKAPTPHGEKLAILHPGITFLEYIRNPAARFAHVPLLSQNEVAAILNVTPAKVRWLVHKKKLASIHVDHRTRQGLRFTPEHVRQFILRKTGRDPKQRAEPTSQALIDWFWKVLQLNSVTNPVDVIDDDLRSIDDLPEPERSQKIEEMMRLAEQAREQLASQCEE